ncbi:hypothetical protein Ahia01_000588600 [Argonauta hians]
MDLNVDKLSTSEQKQIWQVLQRDKALQNKQYSKINELRTEIQDIRMKGILRDGDDSSRLCARCHSQLGVIFNKGEICPNCRFKMCKNCRVALLSGGWTCIYCFKQMQLKWLSGDWTHGKVQPRERTRRASGSDLLRSAIVKAVDPGNAGKAVTEEIRRAITNGSVPPPDDQERDSSLDNSPLGGSTQFDPDAERAGFPSESDSFRLSRLIGRPGNEEKERVCVKRATSRPYRDSDSDSSSSLAASPTLSATKKSGNIPQSSRSVQDKTPEGGMEFEQKVINGHKKQLSPMSNYTQESQPNNNITGSISNSNELEQGKPKLSSPGVSPQAESKPRLIDLARSRPTSPQNMSLSIDGNQSALTTQNISASINSAKSPTSYKSDAGSEHELFRSSPSKPRNIPSSDGSDNEQPIDSYFTTDFDAKSDTSPRKKTDSECFKPLEEVNSRTSKEKLPATEYKSSNPFYEYYKIKIHINIFRKQGNNKSSIPDNEQRKPNEILEEKLEKKQKPRSLPPNTDSAKFPVSKRKIAEQTPFTEEDRKSLSKSQHVPVEKYIIAVEETKIESIYKPRFKPDTFKPDFGSVDNISPIKQLARQTAPISKETTSGSVENISPIKQLARQTAPISKETTSGSVENISPIKQLATQTAQISKETTFGEFKEVSPVKQIPDPVSTKLRYDPGISDIKDKHLPPKFHIPVEEELKPEPKQQALCSQPKQDSVKHSSQNREDKTSKDKLPTEEYKSSNPFYECYKIKKHINIFRKQGNNKSSIPDNEQRKPNEILEEKLEKKQKPRSLPPNNDSAEFPVSKRKIAEQTPFTEEDRKKSQDIPVEENSISAVVEEKIESIHKPRFKPDTLKPDFGLVDNISHIKQLATQTAPISKETTSGSVENISPIKQLARQTAPISKETRFGSVENISPIKQLARQTAPISKETTSGSVENISPIKRLARQTAPISKETISGSVEKISPIKQLARQTAPISKETPSGSVENISPIKHLATQTAPISKETTGGSVENISPIKQLARQTAPISKETIFGEVREVSPVKQIPDPVSTKLRYDPGISDIKDKHIPPKFHIPVEEELKPEPKQQALCSLPKQDSVKHSSQNRDDKTSKDKLPTEEYKSSNPFYECYKIKKHINIFRKQGNNKSSIPDNEQRKPNEILEEKLEKKQKPRSLPPNTDSAKFPVSKRKIAEQTPFTEEDRNSLSKSQHVPVEKYIIAVEETKIESIYKPRFKPDTFKPDFGSVDNISPIKQLATQTAPISKETRFGSIDNISPIKQLARQTAPISKETTSGSVENISPIKQLATQTAPIFKETTFGEVREVSPVKHIPYPVSTKLRYDPGISDIKDKHLPPKFHIPVEEELKSEPKQQALCSQPKQDSVKHSSQNRDDKTSKDKLPTEEYKSSNPFYEYYKIKKHINIFRKQGNNKSSIPDNEQRKHNEILEEKLEKKQKPRSLPPNTDSAEFPISKRKIAEQTPFTEEDRKKSQDIPVEENIFVVKEEKVESIYKPRFKPDSLKPDPVSTKFRYHPGIGSVKVSEGFLHVSSVPQDSPPTPKLIPEKSDIRPPNSVVGQESSIDRKEESLCVEFSKLKKQESALEKDDPKNKNSTFSIKQKSCLDTTPERIFPKEESNFASVDNISPIKQLATQTAPISKETTGSSVDNISPIKQLATQTAPKSKETTGGSVDNISPIKQLATQTAPISKETTGGSVDNISPIKQLARQTAPISKETTSVSMENISPIKQLAGQTAPISKETTSGSVENISPIKQLARQTAPISKETTSVSMENISPIKQLARQTAPISKETIFGEVKEVSPVKQIPDPVSTKLRYDPGISDIKDKHLPHKFHIPVEEELKPEPKQQALCSQPKQDSVKHSSQNRDDKTSKDKLPTEEYKSSNPFYEYYKIKKHINIFRNQGNNKSSIPDNEHRKPNEILEEKLEKKQKPRSLPPNTDSAKFPISKRKIAEQTPFTEEDRKKSQDIPVEENSISAVVEEKIESIHKPRFKPDTLKPDFGLVDNIFQIKKLATKTAPISKETTSGSVENISPIKQLARQTAPIYKETRFGTVENISPIKQLARQTGPISKETTSGSVEKISPIKQLARQTAPISKETISGSVENISPIKQLASQTAPISKETTFGEVKEVSPVKQIPDPVSTKLRYDPGISDIKDKHLPPKFHIPVEEELKSEPKQQALCSQPKQDSVKHSSHNRDDKTSKDKLPTEEYKSSNPVYEYYKIKKHINLFRKQGNNKSSIPDNEHRKPNEILEERLEKKQKPRSLPPNTDSAEFPISKRKIAEQTPFTEEDRKKSQDIPVEESISVVKEEKVESIYKPRFKPDSLKPDPVSTKFRYHPGIGPVKVSEGFLHVSSVPQDSPSTPKLIPDKSDIRPPPNSVVGQESSIDRKEELLCVEFSKLKKHESALEKDDPKNKNSTFSIKQKSCLDTTPERIFPKEESNFVSVDNISPIKQLARQTAPISKETTSGSVDNISPIKQLARQTAPISKETTSGSVENISPIKQLARQTAPISKETTSGSVENISPIKQLARQTAPISKETTSGSVDNISPIKQLATQTAPISKETTSGSVENISPIKQLARQTAPISKETTSGSVENISPIKQLATQTAPISKETTFGEVKEVSPVKQIPDPVSTKLRYDPGISDIKDKHLPPKFHIQVEEQLKPEPKQQALCSQPKQNSLKEATKDRNDPGKRDTFNKRPEVITQPKCEFKDRSISNKDSSKIRDDKTSKDKLPTDEYKSSNPFYEYYKIKKHINIFRKQGNNKPSIPDNEQRKPNEVLEEKLEKKQKPRSLPPNTNYAEFPVSKRKIAEQTLFTEEDRKSLIKSQHVPVEKYIIAVEETKIESIYKPRFKPDTFKPDIRSVDNISPIKQLATQTAPISKETRFGSMDNISPIKQLARQTAPISKETTSGSVDNISPIKQLATQTAPISKETTSGSVENISPIKQLATQTASISKETTFGEVKEVSPVKQIPDPVSTKLRYDPGISDIKDKHLPPKFHIQVEEQLKPEPKQQALCSQPKQNSLKEATKDRNDPGKRDTFNKRPEVITQPKCEFKDRSISNKDSSKIRDDKTSKDKLPTDEYKSSNPFYEYYKIKKHINIFRKQGNNKSSIPDNEHRKPNEIMEEKLEKKQKPRSLPPNTDSAEFPISKRKIAEQTPFTEEDRKKSQDIPVEENISVVKEEKVESIHKPRFHPDTLKPDLGSVDNISPIKQLATQTAPISKETTSGSVENISPIKQLATQTAPISKTTSGSVENISPIKQLAGQTAPISKETTSGSVENISPIKQLATQTAPISKETTFGEVKEVSPVKQIPDPVSTKLRYDPGISDIKDKHLPPKFHIPVEEELKPEPKQQALCSQPKQDSVKQSSQNRDDKTSKDKLPTEEYKSSDPFYEYYKIKKHINIFRKQGNNKSYIPDNEQRKPNEILEEKLEKKKKPRSLPPNTDSAEFPISKRKIAEQTPFTEEDRKKSQDIPVEENISVVKEEKVESIHKLRFHPDSLKPDFGSVDNISPIKQLARQTAPISKETTSGSVENISPIKQLARQTAPISKETTSGSVENISPIKQLATQTAPISKETTFGEVKEVSPVKQIPDPVSTKLRYDPGISDIKDKHLPPKFLIPVEEELKSEHKIQALCSMPKQDSVKHSSQNRDDKTSKDKLPTEEYKSSNPFYEYYKIKKHINIFRKQGNNKSSIPDNEQRKPNEILEEKLEKKQKPRSLPPNTDSAKFPVSKRKIAEQTPFTEEDRKSLSKSQHVPVEKYIIAVEETKIESIYKPRFKPDTFKPDFGSVDNISPIKQLATQTAPISKETRFGSMDNISPIKQLARQTAPISKETTSGSVENISPIKQLARQTAPIFKETTFGEVREVSPVKHIPDPVSTKLRYDPGISDIKDKHIPHKFHISVEEELKPEPKQQALCSQQKQDSVKHSSQNRDDKTSKDKLPTEEYKSSNTFYEYYKIKKHINIFRKQGNNKSSIPDNEQRKPNEILEEKLEKKQKPRSLPPNTDSAEFPISKRKIAEQTPFTEEDRKKSQDIPVEENISVVKEEKVESIYKPRFKPDTLKPDPVSTKFRYHPGIGPVKVSEGFLHVSSVPQDSPSTPKLIPDNSDIRPPPNSVVGQESSIDRKEKSLCVEFSKLKKHESALEKDDLKNKNSTFSIKQKSCLDTTPERIFPKEESNFASVDNISPIKQLARQTAPISKETISGSVENISPIKQLARQTAPISKETTGGSVDNISPIKQLARQTAPISKETIFGEVKEVSPVKQIPDPVSTKLRYDPGISDIKDKHLPHKFHIPVEEELKPEPKQQALCSQPKQDSVKQSSQNRDDKTSKDKLPTEEYKSSNPFYEYYKIKIHINIFRNQGNNKSSIPDNEQRKPNEILEEKLEKKQKPRSLPPNTDSAKFPISKRKIAEQTPFTEEDRKKSQDIPAEENSISVVVEEKIESIHKPRFKPDTLKTVPISTKVKFDPSIPDFKDSECVKPSQEVNSRTSKEKLPAKEFVSSNPFYEYYKTKKYMNLFRKQGNNKSSIPDNEHRKPNEILEERLEKKQKPRSLPPNTDSAEFPISKRKIAEQTPFTEEDRKKSQDIPVEENISVVEEEKIESIYKPRFKPDTLKPDPVSTKLRYDPGINDAKDKHLPSKISSTVEEDVKPEPKQQALCSQPKQDSLKEETKVRNDAGIKNSFNETPKDIIPSKDSSQIRDGRNSKEKFQAEEYKSSNPFYEYYKTKKYIDIFRKQGDNKSSIPDNEQRKPSKEEKDIKNDDSIRDTFNKISKESISQSKSKYPGRRISHKVSSLKDKDKVSLLKDKDKVSSQIMGDNLKANDEDSFNPFLKYYKIKKPLNVFPGENLSDKSIAGDNEEQLITEKTKKPYKDNSSLVVSRIKMFEHSGKTQGVDDAKKWTKEPLKITPGRNLHIDDKSKPGIVMSSSGKGRDVLKKDPNIMPNIVGNKTIVSSPKTSQDSSTSIHSEQPNKDAFQKNAQNIKIAPNPGKTRISFRGEPPPPSTSSPNKYYSDHQNTDMKSSMSNDTLEYWIDRKETTLSFHPSFLSKHDVDSYSKTAQTKPSSPSVTNKINLGKKSPQKFDSDPVKQNNSISKVLAKDKKDKTLPIFVPVPDHRRSSGSFSEMEWIDHKETKLILSSQKTYKRYVPKVSDRFLDISSISCGSPSTPKVITDIRLYSNSAVGMETSIDRKEVLLYVEFIKLKKHELTSEKNDSRNKKLTFETKQKSSLKTTPEMIPKPLPTSDDGSKRKQSEFSSKEEVSRMDEKHGFQEKINQTLNTAPETTEANFDPIKDSEPGENETELNNLEDIPGYPPGYNSKKIAEIPSKNINPVEYYPYNPFDKYYRSKKSYEILLKEESNLGSDGKLVKSTWDHATDFDSLKPEKHVLHTTDKNVGKILTSKDKETTFGPEEDISATDERVPLVKSKETTLENITNSKEANKLASKRSKETTFDSLEDVSPIRQIATPPFSKTKETTFDSVEVSPIRQLTTPVSPRSKETTFDSVEYVSPIRQIATPISPKSQETTFDSVTTISPIRQLATQTAPKTKETTFDSVEISPIRQLATPVSPKTKETTFDSVETISPIRQLATQPSPKSQETTFGSVDNTTSFKQLATPVSPRSKEKTFDSVEEVSPIRQLATPVSPRSKETTFDSVEEVSPIRQLATPVSPRSKETTFDSVEVSPIRQLATPVSPRSKETTFDSVEEVSPVRQLATPVSPKSKETTFDSVEVSPIRQLATPVSPRSKETFDSVEEVSPVRQLATPVSPKSKETTFDSVEVSPIRQIATPVSPRSKETTFDSVEEVSPGRQLATPISPKTKETTFDSVEEVSPIKQLATQTVHKSQETTFGSVDDVSSVKQFVRQPSTRSIETTFGSVENIPPSRQFARQPSPKSKATTFGSVDNVSSVKHYARRPSKSKETTFGSVDDVSSPRQLASRTPRKSQETTFGSVETISPVRKLAAQPSPKSKETTFGSVENISPPRQLATRERHKSQETTFGSVDNVSLVKHYARRPSKSKETTFGSVDNISPVRVFARQPSPKSKETTFGSVENISPIRQLATQTAPKSKQTTFGSVENIPPSRLFVRQRSPKSKETTFGSVDNVSSIRQLARQTVPKSKETTFGSVDNVSSIRQLARQTVPKSKETTFGSVDDVSPVPHLATPISPKSKETTFGSVEEVSPIRQPTTLSPKSQETTFGPVAAISPVRQLATQTAPKSKETTFDSVEDVSPIRQIATPPFSKTKETTFDSVEISPIRQLATPVSPKSQETTFDSVTTISPIRQLATQPSPKSQETTFGSVDNTSSFKQLATPVSPRSKETTFDSVEEVSPIRQLATPVSPKSKETTFDSVEEVSPIRQLATPVSPRSKETTFDSVEEVSPIRQLATPVSPKSKETAFDSVEEVSPVRQLATPVSPKSKETTFDSVEVSPIRQLVTQTTPKSQETTFDSVEISPTRQLVRQTAPKSKETTFDSVEEVSPVRQLAAPVFPKSKETTFDSVEEVPPIRQLATPVSPKSKETTFGSVEDVSPIRRIASQPSPKSTETTFGSAVEIKQLATHPYPKSKETTFDSVEIISTPIQLARQTAPKSTETTFGSVDDVSPVKQLATQSTPKSHETTFDSVETISPISALATHAAPKSQETTFGSVDDVSPIKQLATQTTPKSKETTFDSVEIFPIRQLVRQTAPKSKETTFDSVEEVSPVRQLATPMSSISQETTFDSVATISPIRQLATQTSPKSQETTFGSVEEVSPVRQLATHPSPKSLETTFDSVEPISPISVLATHVAPKSQETTFGSISPIKQLATQTAPRSLETTFDSVENISIGEIATHVTPKSQETTFGSIEEVSPIRQLATPVLPKSKETTFDSVEPISPISELATRTSPKSQETTFASVDEISPIRQLATQTAPRSLETTFDSVENISIGEIATHVTPRSQETTFGSVDDISPVKQLTTHAVPKSYETTFDSVEPISAISELATQTSPKSQETTFGSVDDVSPIKQLATRTAPRSLETTFDSVENISPIGELATHVAPKSQETTFGSVDDVSPIKQLATRTAPTFTDKPSLKYSAATPADTIKSKVRQKSPSPRRPVPAITRYVSSLHSGTTSITVKDSALNNEKESYKTGSSFCGDLSIPANGEPETNIDYKIGKTKLDLDDNKTSDEDLHWIDRKELRSPGNCRESFNKKKPLRSTSFGDKLSSTVDLKSKPLLADSALVVSDNTTQECTRDLEPKVSRSKVPPRFSAWISFDKKAPSSELSVMSHNRHSSRPHQQNNDYDNIKGSPETKRTERDFNNTVGRDSTFHTDPTTVINKASEPKIDYYVDRREYFHSQSKTHLENSSYTYTDPNSPDKNDSIETILDERNDTTESLHGESNLLPGGICETDLDKLQPVGRHEGLITDDCNTPQENKETKLRIELEFNQRETTTPDSTESDNQSFKVVNEYTSIDPTFSQSQVSSNLSRSYSSNEYSSNSSETGAYFIEMNSNTEQATQISDYPVEYNDKIISYSSYPKQQFQLPESLPSKQPVFCQTDDQENSAMKLKQSSNNRQTKDEHQQSLLIPDRSNSDQSSPLYHHSINKSDTDSTKVGTPSNWNISEIPMNVESFSSDLSHLDADPPDRSHHYTPPAQRPPAVKMSPVSSFRDLVLQDERMAYERFIKNPPRNYQYLQETPHNQRSAKPLKSPSYEEDQHFHQTELSDNTSSFDIDQTVRPNPYPGLPNVAQRPGRQHYYPYTKR